MTTSINFSQHIENKGVAISVQINFDGINDANDSTEIRNSLKVINDAIIAAVNEATPDSTTKNIVATVPHNKTSIEITGLEKGKEYEIMLRQKGEKLAADLSGK